MNVKEDIILGFPEKISKNSLLSLSEDDDFPSLLGGSPVWFSEKAAQNSVPCKLCKSESTFLLQLFTPLEMEHTYHRVIYVFFCQNPSCVNRAESITVLRDQLKRSDEIKPYMSTEVSKIRQLDSIYRIETDTVEPKETLFLDKEYEKIANPFDVDDKEYKTVQISKKYAVKAENFDKENSLLKKFMQLAMEDKDFGKELDKQFAQEDEDDDDDEDLDPCFEKYCFLLKKQDSHILRYCRNRDTLPLWYSDKHQWSPIKKTCPHCSKNLIFEFQINSSVLNHFASLIEYDWGIIAVYTCENSCKAGVLKEEHVELQVVLEKEQTEENIKQHLKNMEKYCVEEEDEEQEEGDDQPVKEKAEEKKIEEIEMTKPKKNKNKNKKKKKAVVGESEETEEVKEEDGDNKEGDGSVDW